MNKAAKLLKALWAIIRQPSLLNNILNTDEGFRSKVEKQSGFTSLPVVDIRTFLGDGEKVEPYSFLDGTSSLLDLALLKSLARKFENCSYLEIGTWRGESVANVAAVAKECITVNLPDETLLAMGKPKEYVGAHRFFSASLPNVKHVQADSSAFDFNSLQKKFDLIFVDGDHHANMVSGDTSKIFPLLRDEKSMIVWHDYAYSPGVPRYEVLYGILNGLPKHEWGNLYSVSHTMCAIYSRSKLKSSKLVPNEKPSLSFAINILSKPL